MDLLTASSSGSNIPNVKLSFTMNSSSWSMFAKTKNGYENIPLSNGLETEIELGSIAFFYPPENYAIAEFSASGKNVVYGKSLYDMNIGETTSYICYWASFFGDCSLTLVGMKDTGGTSN